jgi:hypothetical protein
MDKIYDLAELSEQVVNRLSFKPKKKENLLTLLSKVKSWQDVKLIRLYFRYQCDILRTVTHIKFFPFRKLRYIKEILSKIKLIGDKEKSKQNLKNSIINLCQMIGALQQKLPYEVMTGMTPGEVPGYVSHVLKKRIEKLYLACLATHQPGKLNSKIDQIKRNIKEWESKNDHKLLEQNEIWDEPDKDETFGKTVSPVFNLAAMVSSAN